MTVWVKMGMEEPRQEREKGNPTQNPPANDSTTKGCASFGLKRWNPNSADLKFSATSPPPLDLALAFVNAGPLAHQSPSKPVRQ